jgi:carboxyvinyl-carboxyphosphonate phosphorylmutase
MAAVQAMHDTLKAMREGTAPAQLQGVASADLIKQLSRDADYQAWLDDFLC